MTSRDCLYAAAAVLALIGSACSSTSPGAPKGTGGDVSSGTSENAGGSESGATAGSTTAKNAVGGGGSSQMGGSDGTSQTGGSDATSHMGGSDSSGHMGGSEGSEETSASGGSPRPRRDGGLGRGGDSGTGGATDLGKGGGSVSTGDGGSSAGCGVATVAQACSTKGSPCSIDVSGTARTYYVQLPSQYSSSKHYPVIFQYHPWGGNAEQAMTMYNIQSSIPDAIYVTPQGLPSGSNNSAGWENTNGRDIAFTKAMIANLEETYCVDTGRIFSLGFSYGGMMSYAIGCEMGDVFRAIAPMSGALYSGCNNGSHPIAMWGSHGISDSVVPIANGRKGRDEILKRNHCGTETTPVDPSPCVSYNGCDDGYPVIWCEFEGDHGMPSFERTAVPAFLKQYL